MYIVEANVSVSYYADRAFDYGYGHVVMLSASAAGW